MKGIFPGKSNRWFCHTLMVYEVAWGIASFFTSLFQCAPIQSYWLLQSPVRDCLDVSALYYSTSGLNIFTDCTYQDIRREQLFVLTDGRPSPYLPLASERPRIGPDLGPPTHYIDHHVLSWCHHLHCWSVSRMVHLYLYQFLGLPLYVSHHRLTPPLAYFPASSVSQFARVHFSFRTANQHQFCRARHRPLRNYQHRNLYRNHLRLSSWL
jgi:hypothetical protein